MVMCHCFWSQGILSVHFSLDGTREYRHIAGSTHVTGVSFIACMSPERTVSDI